MPIADYIKAGIIGLRTMRCHPIHKARMTATAALHKSNSGSGFSKVGAGDTAIPDMQNAISGR